ncbi:hypothetical protein EJB05_50183, partial [Eragrostis curvula]
MERQPLLLCRDHDELLSSVFSSRSASSSPRPRPGRRRRGSASLAPSPPAWRCVAPSGCPPPSAAGRWSTPSPSAAARAAYICCLAAERVVINTALNATDLLRLYATCAPPSVAPSSCDDDGGASRAAAEPPSSAFDPCAPAALADQMGLFCGLPGRPNAPCCLAVVAAVQLGGGDEPCFCRTARLARAVGGARGLIDLYSACGGLSTDRASHLASTCPLMS